MFKAIMCFSVREKVEVLGGGSTLDILTLTTAICKAVAERIEKEKNIKYEDAIKFVISSINETCTELENTKNDHKKYIV